MSNIKHSDPIFTNENTVRRRAWIERALSGVRESGKKASVPAENGERPPLYLVKPKRSA